jgi:hypothetical protein
VLDRVELHECNYNWKTFIEVYLEDYHVGPFHPGLGSFVTCDDLRWEFGPLLGADRGRGQPPGQGRQPGLPQVARRAAALPRRPPPKYGAIWLTYYPHVMVEWYPHVLVVSTLHPGPQKTLNVVEFFYPEEIAAFEREFVEAQQAAYMETCVEDDEIALRMDAGRKALMKRGDNEVGPYQSPMEDGMQHFHEWYREAMGGTPAAASQRHPAFLMPRGISFSPGQPEGCRRSGWCWRLLLRHDGVCVKIASAWFNSAELVFWRGPDRHVFHVAAGARARVSLATRYPGMHAWRSLVGVVSLGAWFYAIAGLPLATAMTLNYMSSVWIAAFLVGGALLAWNPVPGRDGAAARRQGALALTVLAGFVGVVLMLRPTIERQHQVSPGWSACCRA